MTVDETNIHQGTKNKIVLNCNSWFHFVKKKNSRFFWLLFVIRDDTYQNETISKEIQCIRSKMSSSINSHYYPKSSYIHVDV